MLSDEVVERLGGTRGWMANGGARDKPDGWAWRVWYDDDVGMKASLCFSFMYSLIIYCFF